MSQTKSLVRLLFLSLLWPLTLSISGQTGATNVAPANANVLLTASGKVEGMRGNAQDWSPAKVNDTFKFRDKVRTGLRSKATLRLSNQSIMQLDQVSVIEILPPTQETKRSLLDMKSGAAFFYNREAPVETEFRTPVASGAIRGTEFHLAVAENGSTVVTLIDGAVDLTNNLGQVSLTSGEQGIVEPGQAPRKTAVIDAVNIIQWALYYPAVVDIDEIGLTTDEQNKISNSIGAYRQGDLLQALNLYPTNRTGLSAAERIYEAALVLSVGQVPQAESALAGLGNQSGQAQKLADAIREVIAAVKFKPWTRSSSPTLGSEWLAESYCLQSQSKLEEARTAAREAVKVSPQFGFAWARLAEMEFSFGKIDAAREAIEKALQYSPRNAQALSLKGYLLAAANKIDPALDYFNQAIAIDGNLGNAWLGRGLCKIKRGMDFFFLRGQSTEGRQDIQTASVLEPNRAVFRSYLGKAHENEGSFKLAMKELDLSKKLDEKDPTAWLYSALLNMQYNRLNQAVDDLEHSKDLNSNRRVYRSKLLLDQDQAVRGANLASIYRDEGMVEWSIREASRAVDSDYGNFSAHLFLASSYDALRDPRQINLRYETPWLSELLLANLLAPVGAGPLSQNISQQEYSKLFERDRLGFSSQTIYLSTGDWYQNASQFGTFGSTSYSIDAEYRSDKGQRPNNDFESFTSIAKVKEQLTPHDSVFFQATYSDVRAGDVHQDYDQSNFFNYRIKERQEPLIYAGYHHEWAPGSHTLFLGARLNDTFLYNDPTSPTPFVSGGGTLRQHAGTVTDFRSELEGFSTEVQQIQQLKSHTLIAGIRYQHAPSDSTSSILSTQDSPPRTFTNNADTDLWRVSFYAYDHWDILENLRLTAGLTYDRLHYPVNIAQAPISSDEAETDRLSPKAGFVWSITKNTHFRGIYSRSLGGAFFDQSVRLEPTQLAGFNQAFRSLIPESIQGLIPGTRFETGGLGLDHNFETKTYVSLQAEILRSDATRRIGVLTGGGGILPVPTSTGLLTESLDYEEKSALVTVNQLLGDEWSVGARYKLTHADLSIRTPAVPGSYLELDGADTEAVLHQLGMYVIYNHRCGFFSQFDSVYSAQSNRGYTVDKPGDDFLQHNFYVGYRFHRRFAEVRLGIVNLTDRDYKLNPLTLYNELPRERTFVASLKLNF